MRQDKKHFGPSRIPFVIRKTDDLQRDPAFQLVIEQGDTVNDDRSLKSLNLF
jgi:hypothetical protein